MSTLLLCRTSFVPRAAPQLDPATGAVRRRFGAGLLAMPHMITPDIDGRLWVVDTGRQQALRFSTNGSLLSVVGTQGEPGQDTAHFCKPTQVRWRSPAG